MSTASVSAQTLAKMPNPYVVKVIDFPAGPAVICAGEGYGPVVAIDPVRWDVRTIAVGPGGCLDVTPVPGHNAIYMIGGSFVGYDFHRSGVYRLDLPDPDNPDISDLPVRLFNLPFAHRLQSFRNADGVHLVAASIAQSKRDRDDWSRPGTVYVADLGDGLTTPERGAEPPTPAARTGIPGNVPIPLRPILVELHKNHGLTTVHADDEEWLYISGTEGTFRAQFPATNESLWEFQRMFDHEISELFFIDLDNDGVDELVTIEPFHGDRLAVYRVGRKGTRAKDARSGSSRETLGSPTVVPGGIARAGGLRHDAPRDATNTRGTTLPSDATEGPDYIIASNQEQGEIVRYTVG